ncbi:MAG: glycosyltransferase family 2 protein [Cyanobacteria bacterium SZAS-4]|nr:glycosyltransferase family 2 protein [Cyanobacteria bacterium SZAS-4]
MYSQTPNTLSNYEPDLVSVIIPTYNRVALLVEAIESVRRQTWTKVQIIVVDDGSTDGTRVKIEAMQDVQYIWQENRGQAAARNRGLREARGEFICTLDSDDLWFPHFLKESISAIKEQDLDFVFSNWFRQNKDGSQIRSYFETDFPWWKEALSERAQWRLLKSETIREYIQFKCCAPSSAFVFRRNLISEGWQESVKITDDWALLQDILIAKQCRVGVFMPRSWVKRVNSDNICDVETTKVKRAMEIDSPQRLLRKNHKLLSKRERSRINRRLAISALALLKKETGSGNNVIRNATDFCMATFFAFATAPIESFSKLMNRGVYLVEEPSSEDLLKENLLEPPDQILFSELDIPVQHSDLATL